ncbi:low molecular weight phosphatase family protein [Sinomonas sp. P47F7]|uniref:arsenate reductase/protein-tyrosine-phosphatase family protein n=1 Tax=Sinomonas sp. P47F7 TaxID=3410987 RepID=UPI003BF50CF7
MGIGGPFRILTVCTGNVSRSPVVERLLRSGLEEAAPGVFEVSSAGTRALSGEGAQPESEDLTARLGSSLAGFRARQLNESLVVGSDVILGLAEAHVREILSYSPSALKRTFTLRQFARAVASFPRAASRETVGDAWAGYVENAAQSRNQFRTGDPLLDDVADPFGRGAPAYERMAEELVPAVEALIRAAAVPRRSRTHALGDPTA